MIEKIRHKIKTFIDDNKLVAPGDTVLVGVSGGADSVMLLDCLDYFKESYGIKLEVAHVHHGARLASDEEERYVKEICEQRKIPCHVHHCSIKDVAKQRKLSEEEAGRIERYRFFISLTNRCDKIATAHTMNDQAETMIMRFLRGADVKGLGGIPTKREQIIRPLLCVSRKEVEMYCELRKLRYYQDESNFTTQYTRNKVRLECIPYIQKEINENVIQMLASHAELYQQEEEFLQDYVDKLYQKSVVVLTNQQSIDLKNLENEKLYIKKKLLLKCIAALTNTTKDITLIHINECLGLSEKQSGKQIHLPNGIVVKRMYDQLVVQKRETDIFTDYEYRLQLGINNIEVLKSKVSCELVDRKRFEQSKENMYTKYIDYDKIKDNLRIRTKQSGDRIVLEQGSKKVKKLLIDAKVPSNERNHLPLVVDGEQVVWIVGVRLSSQYFVTDDTKHILEMKLLNKKTQEGLC